MRKPFLKHLLNYTVLTSTFIILENFVTRELKATTPDVHTASKSTTLNSVKKPPSVRSSKKMIVPNNKSKAYTVYDVIADVLASSPSILADLSAKREAIERIRQAEGGYYPTIDLRADSGFDYVRDKFKENILNSSVNGSVRTWKRRGASINITQGLFSGFDTVNRVDKANKEVGEAQFKYEETQHLLAFEAARIFVDLRRLQRLVKLAEQNISYHQNILSKIKNLVSAGKNTITDSQHVEARLADAQAVLEDIKGDYASSISRFIELTGHEPGNLANARVPDNFLPKSLKEAFSVAQERNRSLKIAKATVDVAKADLATTDAPFYPSVNIEAEAGRNLNAAGDTGQQTTMTALLVARYNIFNGFQNISKTREYINRITTAKYRRDAEMRRIEREVRTAWEEMKTAYQQSLALENASTHKKSVLNSNLAQFDTGTSSFSEILNSAHEWFLAQGSKITANASQDKASLKLLAVTGRLIELYTGNQNLKNYGKMMPISSSEMPMKKNIEDFHKTIRREP